MTVHLWCVEMPRNKGKKKKGRVVKPGMEQSLAEKLVAQVNQKLAAQGMATQLNATQGTESAAASDSALNASQYTYYSESINQSTMIDGDTDKNDAPTDV